MEEMPNYDEFKLATPPEYDEPDDGRQGAAYYARREGERRRWKAMADASQDLHDDISF